MSEIKYQSFEGQHSSATLDVSIHAAAAESDVDVNQLERLNKDHFGDQFCANCQKSEILSPRAPRQVVAMSGWK